ncbi:VWA domain-containing protein [Motilimonas sp. E26]|uniref:vWA domain-containing protein n=1 Tax=Motilimonas sp. E26 TaxID=2865674 RepID=UPI001E540BA8|nr:VWA domain-containing protein [Motilimonas sp. E26]MCE0556309.1 VWA domain-containing protein [Motilimonas sp. E26]
MSTAIIPGVEFIDNANQRTPCVLVLDASGSMTGEPLRQLNLGLKVFEEQLKNDLVAAMRVQVLVIAVGGLDDVEVLQPWVDAADFNAPTIEPGGLTPLGAGMERALTEVQQQKSVYDANGISSTRPWVILLSDGCPTDLDWDQSASRCREAEADKKVVIFPIGTEGADFEALGQFSNKSAKKLKGLNFTELFVWLSRSMATVSASVPGQKVKLPSADEWAEVDI